ncbi:GNAT family N-acetyltransferase [Vibrio salinus]|uniref:GNAT family N-acetyltransferase n=1 Tax=Vibrio salinus TaxID=2899784 RepID=UPI001E43950F|nr:GNAT family N-acetyltransferase [Vibrio salinus]MCE0495461.1 GNAT family N-acetyltransferase [Vibrio salinus]
MLTFSVAEKEDSSLILKYIQDLAVAEQFPFDVSVTIQDIETNLFGSDSVATAVIMHFDTIPCGFAVFYYTFSTTTGKRGLHLDDLYIEPEFQGKGIGKKTLCYLARLAEEKECARFEWWALKTNDAAIKFYLRVGAKKLDEISVFRLDKYQLRELADSE